MPSYEGTTNAVIIWRMRGVGEIHSTLLKELSNFHREMAKGNNRFLLAGVEPRVMATLKATGLLEELGEENVIAARPGIGAALDIAWAEAQTWLAMHPKAE
jgi:SulP family sulfate permease